MLPNLFRDRWYLLTDPDPIHTGLYWRLYHRVACIFPPFYEWYCKAEKRTRYAYPPSISTFTFIKIYNGHGASYVSVMGSSIWDDHNHRLYGDDDTKIEFNKNCKTMNKTELTEDKVKELLFVEAI